MSYDAGKYDVAVIGAGHAGIEAALASARLGCRTVIFNDRDLTIHSRPAHKLALGHMSCIRLAAYAVLFPPGNAGADKLILSHGARYLCLPA